MKRLQKCDTKTEVSLAINASVLKTSGCKAHLSESKQKEGREKG